MDTTKLELTKYKNYKVLCEITNQPIKTGKSKNIQLEDWKRYFSWEREGNSFIITDIYDEPYEKDDNRKSKYYDSLETVILFALDKASGNRVLWSINKALSITNMVNDNYKYGRVNLDKTSKALEVDKDYIYDFYNTCGTRFKRIFESAISRMERKALVDVKICTMVCKKISRIKLNDLGDPVIDSNGKLNYTTERVFAEATDDECIIISEIKGEILKKIGMKDTQECLLKRRLDLFNSLMNKELSSRLNVEFAYKGYRIIKNNNKIIEEITELTDRISKQQLNKLVVDGLNDSNDKTLNKISDDKDILIDYLIDITNKTDLKDLIHSIEAQMYDDLNIPF